MVGKTIICCLALALCVSITYAVDTTDEVTCSGTGTTYTGVAGVGRIGSQLCSNIAVFEMNLADTMGSFSADTGRWTPTDDSSKPFGTMKAVQKDYIVDYYEAQYIQFRTPAEHVIRNERASLEMQIYFKNKNTDRTNAYFTIPMNHTAPPAYEFKQNASKVTGIEGTFGSISSLTTPATYTLSKISTRVNEWPLFYRYNGSDTDANGACLEPVTYYVYSSTFYLPTTIIEAVRSFYTSTFTNGAALAAVTISGSTFSEFVQLTSTDTTTVNFETQTDVVSNARGLTSDDTVTIDAELVERFCYREFWRNHIPFNYGLWFAIGMLALYFCFQLCTPGDMPIRDPEYQESAKTLHPLYSLWRVSNDIFTRRTRFTVLWMNLTNNAIIAAAFITGDFRLASPGTIEGWEIYCYGLAAAGFGGMATYLWGHFLRKYYICKFKSFQSKGDPAKSDKFNEDANFYLYCFYFMTFAWFWGGNWLFIWMMSRINPKDKIGVIGQSNKEKSIRWIGAFGVSIAMDWLVLDIFFAILGKISFFRRILKWKGYMYDDLCHKTYLMYSKEE